ncbi:hypothetical protein BCR33DRAFT_847819 [Rhizoclosmatium globosum]|uniref:Transcription factor IIIC subunit 5 HTH domain-containing protein n=1 Tax=Rhizoclosmatium globosum TaxID=329046 RepID=A0A1Y2CQ61_9FUNG|nr:hypothetical protein BCR33DRAFT_847819 [Rhizoclosmatium globosum]|eukprot:ORY49171.1 hypothetical protein BCR33DRAFT_847819 [Rhizoclosmatium globosum]
MLSEDQIAPSLPLRNWQFNVIELPGRITSGSPEGAVAALGGMDAIERAFSNDLVPLELRVRPEDPFAHPLLGEIIATSNLVLKVSKKRKKKGSGPNGEYIDSDYKFVTEIVGIVTKTGRFRALADYQYVVDPEDPMRKLKKSLNDFDIEGISKFELSPDQGVQPNLRSIPPPSFSRIEWSLNYRYQQFTEMAEVRLPPNRGGEVIKVTRRPPRNPMLKFRKDTIRVPSGPTPEILSLLNSSFSGNDHFHTRITQLFTDRPVWTFRALFNNCKDISKKKTDSKLVPFLMTKHAYFITWGPWQECWARYGYDPRQEREARFYQIVSMRSIKIPTTLKRAKRLIGVNNRERLLGALANLNEEDDDKSHIFDGTLWKGVARMQVCDITDPDVVRIVQSTRGRRSCDVKDGWFDTAVIESIRKIVRTKIMQQTGRQVDETDLPEYVSDNEEEEEEEDEEEEIEGTEERLEERPNKGKGRADTDHNQNEDDFMEDDINLAVNTSASISSKIDELMKSLQTSQIGVVGQGVNSMMDDEDEFDYFEDEDE